MGTATTTIRVTTTARYRGLTVTVLGDTRAGLLAIAGYGTAQELAIAAIAVKRRRGQRVYCVAGAGGRRASTTSRVRPCRRGRRATALATTRRAPHVSPPGAASPDSVPTGAGNESATPVGSGVQLGLLLAKRFEIASQHPDHIGALGEARAPGMRRCRSRPSRPSSWTSVSIVCGLRRMPGHRDVGARRSGAASTGPAHRRRRGCETCRIAGPARSWPIAAPASRPTRRRLEGTRGRQELETAPRTQFFGLWRPRPRADIRRSRVRRTLRSCR